MPQALAAADHLLKRRRAGTLPPCALDYPECREVNADSMERKMKRVGAGRRPQPSVTFSLTLPFGSLPFDTQKALCEFGARIFGFADKPSAKTAGAVRADAAVEAFVSERCERQADYLSAARDLWIAYGKWAQGKKAPPLTTKALGLALVRLGFIRKKSGVIFYGGLREAKAVAGRRQRAR
jgi:hypothetical protein